MKFHISIPLGKLKYDFKSAEYHYLYINIDKCAGVDIEKHIDEMINKENTAIIHAMVLQEETNILELYVESDRVLTDYPFTAIPCWATDVESYETEVIKSKGRHIIYLEDNTRGNIDFLMEKTNQTPLTITKLYEH